MTNAVFEKYTTPKDDAGSTRDAEPFSSSRSKSALKLAKLTGQTEEERIRSTVEAIVYDGKTAEGATRKQFISDYKKLVKSEGHAEACDNRKFIDEMQAYIMENRFHILSSIMIDVEDKDIDLRSETSRLLQKNGRIETLGEIVMAVAETCMSKALHSQIAKSIKAGLSVNEVKAVKKKLGALLLLRAFSNSKSISVH